MHIIFFDQIHFFTSGFKYPLYVFNFYIKILEMNLMILNKLYLQNLLKKMLNSKANEKFIKTVTMVAVFLISQ
jgi:hypothetical protein